MRANSTHMNSYWHPPLPQPSLVAVAQPGAQILEVDSCGTFLYIVSPQWLEGLKQATDTACRAELTLALKGHADMSMGTALVPVLHADCGVFPSAHIAEIDGSLRQAFSFTFIFHMTKKRHYEVFLEELIERITAVAAGGTVRRKVFLSHKQLDSQELVRPQNMPAHARTCHLQNRSLRRLSVLLRQGRGHAAD